MSPALLAVVVVAAAPAAPKLAMLEWTRVEVTPELGRFYEDHFALGLRARGLGVITSQEIASLLGLERQRELLGCADSGTSCMAELGNALGATAVLKVSVARLDGTVRANISVLSSVDGSVKVETSLAAEEKRVFAALDDAAVLIAEKLLPKRELQGGRLRGLVWAPAAIGGVGLLLGVVSTAVAGVQWSELQTTQSYSQAQANVATGKGAKWLAGFGYVVAGLGAATAVLFYVLGGPTEVTPSVSVTPGGAQANLTWAW